MAVSDAQYKFLYVNIGAKGSASDGGVFNACPLATALKNNTLNVPPNKPLPGRSVSVPYRLLADDAFPESEHIMKPIPGQNLSQTDRIFNYRFSRGRRVIENSFGIATARWRVLRTKIEFIPKNIEKIVGAVCVLHNFCLREEVYLPPNSNLIDRDVNGEIVRGTWHDNHDLISLQSAYSRTNNVLNNIREEFRQYFVSNIGELSWQYEK